MNCRREGNDAVVPQLGKIVLLFKLEAGVPVKKLPKGFIDEPKRDATSQIYRGRFVCPGVQWTGDGNDAFCTFSITAGQLTDAALSDLIWTDQAVQRGIKPNVLDTPPKEISLHAGYPDNRYVFDAANADDIVTKLLHNQRLFLSPLVWNLRLNQFQAFWSEQENAIFIYSGRIYLPDSHHRHQAIVKATNIKREAPNEYASFAEDTQYKVELYFLTREDEGNYFFDKNQRPKPTALSKAFDLSTADDLSVLAKGVISESSALRGNVNRVTDRLVKSDPSVVTLSTLREVMRSIVSSDFVEQTEMEGLAVAIASFFDLLATVRQEITKLDRPSRNAVREKLLVDAAVMFYGYGALAREYVNDIPTLGTSKTKRTWTDRLKRLSSKHEYQFDTWNGDLFEKKNPFWEHMGVTKKNASTGRLTVMNTGAARAAAQRALRRVVRSSGDTSDLRLMLDL